MHASDVTRDTKRADPAGSFSAESWLDPAFTSEMTELVAAACDHDPDDDAIKCVVWDLDDTVWEGVLLEEDTVRLRDGVRDVLETLDRRGIVCSIASRNDRELALQKLEELGLASYFLVPQIGWGDKSTSIQRIAAELNIGIDSLAFVDDQPFERDEVRQRCPAVMCVDASDIRRLLEIPRLMPRAVTDDSRSRRLMYHLESDRRQAQQGFTGSTEDFLASLGLVFTLWPLGDDDLERAAELTKRTHQLNSSGRVYSEEMLADRRRSGSDMLLMAALSDTYGPYGKVGFCHVERGPAVWTIRLLAMSCRVAARRVDAALTAHLLRQAAAAGARLRIDYVPNGRNGAVLDTFRRLGFTEIESDGAALLLEAPRGHTGAMPSFVTIVERAEPPDATLRT